MYLKKWQHVVLARNITLCEEFRRKCSEDELNKLGMLPSFPEIVLTDVGIQPLRPLIEAIGPAFDPYIQIPVDVAHCEQKGIGEKSIKKLMVDIFSDLGKLEFTKQFIAHPFPPVVSRIVNPAFHYKKLQMHQVHIAQIAVVFGC